MIEFKLDDDSGTAVFLNSYRRPPFILQIITNMLLTLLL